MIAGLDSSFDRPTPAVAAQAYLLGIRVWGGYIGTRGGLGLATLWSQADFDVIRNAGMTAIGFCSGWDDPAAVRDLAAQWGVRLCVDVETGIRTDGAWLDQWLAASGAGLYGNASVHYETGRPIGRGAAFNIVSGYFGYDPRATWEPWLSRPSGPCGWQWQGGHLEFGLDVDSSWFDDWFGGDMTADESAKLSALYDLLINGNPQQGFGGQGWIKVGVDQLLQERDLILNGTPQPSGFQGQGWLKVGIDQLLAKSVTVDVNALATALAAKLPAGATAAQIAVAVRQELAGQLAKP